MTPRMQFEVVVRTDRERGDHVFAEILVLVVAPEDDHIGPEGFERRTDAAKAGDKRGPMTRGSAGAPIVGPLKTGVGGPVRRIALGSGNRGIGEGSAENSGHVRIGKAQRRIVAQPEPEYLCHIVSTVGCGRLRSAQPALVALGLTVI